MNLKSFLTRVGWNGWIGAIWVTIATLVTTYGTPVWQAIKQTTAGATPAVSREISGIEAKIRNLSLQKHWTWEPEGRKLSCDKLRLRVMLPPTEDSNKDNLKMYTVHGANQIEAKITPQERQTIAVACEDLVQRITYSNLAEAIENDHETSKAHDRPTTSATSPVAKPVPLVIEEKKMPTIPNE